MCYENKMLQMRRNVINLEDNHFHAEQYELMSKCARLTERLKTHVSTLHLHSNMLD